MKEYSLFAALGLLALVSGPHAAPRPTAPAVEPATVAPPTEIALWPDGLAIARPETTGPEKVRPGGGPIAGKPVTMIENVTRPTMTFYPAKGRNTGATILVFPGGGYQVLAIDLEGSEVCDWATARGISCAVLKYRVPQFWWHKGVQTAPRPQMALQDAERAMGLLRQRAAALAIDPRKIGVLGFSAGGHLVSAISNATGRNYAPVDAADRLSARPDFAVALYPGHLWAQHGVDLYPFDPIRADAPPTFLVQAQDDPVDDVRHSISYFLALRAVKVPVEMHIYAGGGHAFGLRPSDQPITRWPELMDRWLHTIGVL
ncbi:alpha/beta hydrolase [Sphingomonas sp. MMS12-HWE2-04]|uniref:alpha/beta hydrolase n=1 Tax=Sphingomonas sp. MMS12-HWE2-04 TaxID=3234199 RepID=UPI00384EA04A